MRSDQMGFVRISANSKTGPIPVSVSRRTTCPSTCPLKKNGCYAHTGYLRFLWNKLDRGTWGMEWEEFLRQIRRLPRGTFWRHAQAGDLPGWGTSIDTKKLRELVGANRGKQGYTYTHKGSNDLSAIREACANGFTINLSADGPSMADKLFDTGLPVACIVREGTPDVSCTPKGRKIVICPAQSREGVTCDRCRICARSDRDFIVGFRPHGLQYRRVAQVAAVN